MKVTFLSLDDQMNKVHFESEASRNENEIIFVDKTSPNTTIELTIFDNEVKFVRTGSINSEMVFIQNKKTKGNYSYCSRLDITKNKILIHYTLVLDEYMKTNHKISLLLN